MYNILWIDDEHEKLDGLKIQATQNDIKFTPFKSFERGLSELNLNYALYDGILLDARFFEYEEEIAGSEDLSALIKMKEALLRHPKKFEIFVLTGQTQLFKDNTFNEFFPKYFRKGIAEDTNNLFIEIKRAADQQGDTQLRHKYQQVFDVCTEKYIGINANKDLLAILKKEYTENVFSDSNLYFNPLRKIMEDLFIAFNKYGLLPDIFVKPSVALNESSKFLSGKPENGYQFETSVFPNVVSDHVRSILSVCQPAAHRSEIDSFIRQVNTHYLLLSTTYQLLDVLIWLKKYIDSNNDVSLNKSKCKVVVTGNESRIGVIEQDEFENYHCGEIFLQKKNVNEMGVKTGDNIRIIKITDNTNERLNSKYPKISFKFEKI